MVPPHLRHRFHGGSIGPYGCISNDAGGGRPEDPGALRTYAFKAGVLTNRTSVQPGNGLGFGPRHLAFHPTELWVFVSVERQNQIFVYRLESDGNISKDPLFVKTSLAEQAAGAIHVHPNGRFVYQTNRNSTTVEVDSKRVFTDGENNVAVHDQPADRRADTYPGHRCTGEPLANLQLRPKWTRAGRGEHPADGDARWLDTVGQPDGLSRRRLFPRLDGA